MHDEIRKNADRQGCLLFTICTSTAHSFLPMQNSRETQIAWVRAVLAHLGVSATELARRAKIAPSTLQRPLNDPTWTSMLSGRTMAAIAQVAGLAPLEFPNRVRGAATQEAEPYRFDQAEDAADNFDRSVRELCQGRAGREAWQMKSFALELSGILPGDVLIVDSNLTPAADDIVCAQMFDWSGTKAETVFRLFDPPYLVTNSVRAGREKPIAVDNSSVVIKGVVRAILRNRRHQ